MLHTVIESLSVIALLLFVWSIIRVINNADNGLEWEHLFSSRGADGKQYADWNKIGAGAGVVISVWLPAVYAYSDKADGTGIAAVMGVALAYLGSVSGYAAVLRARRGTIETTSTTESDSPTT